MVDGESGGATNIPGSTGADLENSRMSQTPSEDISRTKQSPTVICAAHEHPLFVSEDQKEDAPDDQTTEYVAESQPDVLASSGDLVPVDATKASSRSDNFECRLPPGKNNLHQDNSSSNSHPDSDSDGQRIGRSLDDGLRRDYSSHNASLGSSLSSNGLESSLDEFSSALGDATPQNHSVKHPRNKTEIPSTVISGLAACKSDVAGEPAGGGAGIRAPQRAEGQKSKVLSPPSESGKKSKMKSENSGNNLVFTYKKDSEEIEIIEQASEDSHSGSDLDGETADRGTEIQNNCAELAHAANSDFHARNKNSSFAEDCKKHSKKKKASFGFVLNPNYKFRHDEFKRIFRNIPRNDRLVVDYSCALQKNILVQGRLYISQNWICFYAWIFGVETTVSIPFKDITHITKEKTALVFPNAIQISTKDEKYFFSSLNARDKTYLIISYFWKNANSQEPMSREEMWSWIHFSYGDDLGVSTEEDQDFVVLSPEEKNKHMAKIELEATMCQDLEGLGTSTCLKDAAIDDDTLVVKCDGTFKKSLTKSFNGDLVASEPTDSSGEILCSGHEHFPIHVCDEVLDFSVNKLFDHCFTDSKVFRHFTEIKKTTDVVLSEWPKTPAVGDGELTRNLSYTLSLTLAMTSKKAPATEKQTMYSSSKPGSIYVIDCECHTPTIPYGDSFYIVNRHCLTRVTDAKSRLRITSQIVYQKNVFFKSFIEKNATSGIVDTFKILVELLQKESKGHGGADQDLLTTNPIKAPTAEQLGSKIELGKITQFREFCTKQLESHMRLLLIVLVVAAVMLVLVKFVLFSNGSEMNVCKMQQNAADHDLIHQLQMEIYQQQTEIEKWKAEHIHMMQTIDELKAKIAYLMQQKQI